MKVDRTHNPLFCACCRNCILIPYNVDEAPAPWRIHLKAEGDHSRAWAFCSDACQEKGAAVPAGKPIRAMFDLDRRSGFIARKAAHDAMAGFLEPLSQHPEYLKGHATGMALRAAAEAVIKAWPENQRIIDMIPPVGGKPETAQ